MAYSRRVRGAVFHVLPAVLYGTAIFVGGSWPQGPKTGLEWQHADKLLHFVAFGAFVPLLGRALRYSRPAEAESRHLRGAVLLSIFLGALLEVWQAFLPTREAELLDLLADAGGAVLAALVWWRFTQRRPALE